MYKSLLLIVTSIFFSVLGQTLLKIGVQRGPKMSMDGWFAIVNTLISIFTNFNILAGLFLYAVSAVFWIVVLSRVDLSIAYPMLALGYVMIVLISIFVFKENVSPLRWTGVAIILTGVAMVTRS